MALNIADKDLTSLYKDIEKSDIKIKSINELIKHKIANSFYYFIHDFMRINSIETGNPVIYKDPHEEVCDELTKLDKDIMILLPREFGKTFLMILYLIWYPLHNPNKTIILFSEVTDKAEEILGSVKLMIESHEDFNILYGDILSKRRNTSSELCLKTRTTSAKEPNVIAFGIENSIQGYRCDLQIFEDIIGDNYIKKPKVRRTINNMFFNSSRPLLKKSGKRIYTGTRWDYEDIPGQLMSDLRLSKKWYVIEKSIENSDGNSAYPHIVTNEQLEEIKINVKSSSFYASQYLNKPRNEDECVFDVDYYIKNFGYEELPKIRKKIMAVDLAYSTNVKADDRALVVLGIDNDGIIYIIDAFATNKMKPRIFYNKIKDYYIKYDTYRILVETTNSLPTYDQYIEKSNKEQAHLPLKGIDHQESKNERINTLELPLFNGTIRIPKHYRNNKYVKKLVEELEFYNYNRKDNRDDLIDALETAYSAFKVLQRTMNSPITLVDNRDYKDEIW